MDRKEVLGKAVRSRRDELGYTQSGLRDRALELGHRLAHSTIIAIEAGQRDWATMQGHTRTALMAALAWGPEADRALRAGQLPEATPAPVLELEPSEVRSTAVRIVEELVASRALDMSPVDHVLGVLRCLNDDQLNVVFQAVDRMRVS